MSSEQQSAAESGIETYGSDAEGQGDQKMGNYTASRLKECCFSFVISAIITIELSVITHPMHRFGHWSLGDSPTS